MSGDSAKQDTQPASENILASQKLEAEIKELHEKSKTLVFERKLETWKTGLSVIPFVIGFLGLLIQGIVFLYQRHDAHTFRVTQQMVTLATQLADEDEPGAARVAAHQLSLFGEPAAGLLIESLRMGLKSEVNRAVTDALEWIVLTNKKKADIVLTRLTDSALDSYNQQLSASRFDMGAVEPVFVAWSDIVNTTRANEIDISEKQIAQLMAGANNIIASIDTTNTSDEEKRKLRTPVKSIKTDLTQ